MRQNPVGEPAATAALNSDTPRRRSSLKRLWPFPHCRQRYERNLRRVQASRFVSTRGVWQNSMYPAPPDEVWRQLLDDLRQTEPSCPAGLFPNARLACVEGLWRNPPFAAVIRDAEAQELALLRLRHRALRLVDLQPQLRGQEAAHRGHHPFTGAVAANIDVAVVRVTAETVTTAGQFLVEIVEHEVAQEGRERTALRGPLIHRKHQAVFHHPGR